MVKKLKILFPLAAALLLLSQCMPSGDDDDNDPPEESAPSNGSFQITLVPPQGTSSGFTQVLGTIYDGPTPSSIIWELASTSGDCELYTPRNPFCEVACTGGEICVEDNVCQAFPAKVTVGTVEITGLKTADGQTSFTMNPIASNYQPVGVTFEYPAFDPGDVIGLNAEGSASLEAFSISSHGISPLEIANDTLELLAGTDINLQWTAQNPAGISRVKVEVDISHHGGTKGKIECDAPDNGSLKIASSLLDALKALGVSGYPKIDAERYAKGTNEEAKINLVVNARTTRLLGIPGVVSCASDDDCTDPQLCMADLKCGTP